MNRSDDQRDAALEAFLSYTRAFQALDPRTVASHFAEPAFQIIPDGARLLPDKAAVEQAFKQVMADLPARGYVRTDLSDLHVRHLSHDLTQVSGTGKWKTASDETLMSFGMTYTLRRNITEWRIIVAMIHDPVPS